MLLPAATCRTWIRLAAPAAVVALALACGGPTGPTPQPTPAPTPTPTPAPVAANPPTVGCPDPVIAVSSSGNPMAVSYTAPPAEGGQAPVTVACTPASGSLFPVGTTKVECVATDALSQTGGCAFPVTVKLPAQLSRTRFMAFGDSITAGEVTVPVTTIFPAAQPSYRLVLVPTAAYPTVLGQLLAAAYPSQAQRFVVTNRGKPAEPAGDAPARFVESFNADSPEAVLLMEGYNDICCGSPSSRIDGAIAALGEMAGEARRRGARVFVATLAPSHPGSRAPQPEMLQEINRRIRILAASEGAALVDVYQALLPDVNINIGVDGLHPTEVGYRRMADAFFAAIQADLEAPATSLTQPR